MWDFSWTIWHWDRMFRNTSFYPINIFPKISHNKISFFYHESHITTLPLNKTVLPFSVQEFQSVPVCVGSNNYNNTNKASIFKIVFYPWGCKLLGWNFGRTVCVYMKYKNEKWRKNVQCLLPVVQQRPCQSANTSIASTLCNALTERQYQYL